MVEQCGPPDNPDLLAGLASQLGVEDVPVLDVVVPVQVVTAVPGSPPSHRQ